MILDMLYRQLFGVLDSNTRSMIDFGIICNRGVLGLVCIAVITAMIEHFDCITFASEVSNLKTANS